MLRAIVTACLILAPVAAAQTPDRDTAPTIVHPKFRLLDREGQPVLSSRGPVSGMRSCGACHDTGFIADHNYHASVGADETAEPGSAPGWRPWDLSPGLYGRWAPLLYRYLTPDGDELMDMGTADWVSAFGYLHVGGGPAVRSPAGTPLTNLDPDLPDRDTMFLNEDTGLSASWDWSSSGVVELNCFLCHISSPDNEARIDALRSGAFEWASTATLARSGLVAREGSKWRWIDNAFKEDGTPESDRIRIVPPSSLHCGQCHGLVHFEEEPVIPRYGSDRVWSTETMGGIFSPQLPSRSGMNLAGKSELNSPWDVHAERLLECSDCHFAPNDPSAAAKISASGELVSFDGRRLSIDEFLTTPDHNFAKGRSAQGRVADHLDGTMRRCEDCHSTRSSHEWLPYKGRHMDRLLCEACHVPVVRAPARRATDWTVLNPEGGPRVEYRGVRGDVDDPAALVDGFRPVLLPRRRPLDGGSERLAPHNLISIWFWIHGDPPRPVRLFDLRRAFLEGGGYHPDILRALDADSDGRLDGPELKLDTPEKVDAVRKRLESLGLKDLRIEAVIRPFSLHHGITAGKWAVRECSWCHSRRFGMTQPFLLASAHSSGEIPKPVRDTNAIVSGEVRIGEGGVYYWPVTMEEGFYVLGHDRWSPIDLAGIIIVSAAFAGALVHGGIRVFLSRSRRSGS